MKKAVARQFSVYWCNLAPTFGHQMQKTRPCVVVSPDSMNSQLKTVIIVPITSKRRDFPFYVPVIYKGKNGALACNQIKVIDKSRVGDYFCDLSQTDKMALNSTLIKIFAI
jgi:mRNA interferase MazF